MMFSPSVIWSKGEDLPFRSSMMASFTLGREFRFSEVSCFVSIGGKPVLASL